MSTIPFDPGRARDAWATVRGYVYQVDVTLDRWLGMDEDEILELERGEDIDLCGRTAAAQGDERNRLLEQVKHLDAAVTLRAGEVRAFLANAFAHRTNNPTLHLRFRFTTTAAPTAERPTSMPGSTPGIIAWERIGAGTWPDDSLYGAMSALRELLTAADPPPKLPVVVWTPFQDFLGDASPAEFAAFLRSCEWSTGHIPAAEYESRVITKLVGMGLAPDKDVAASLYDRLFAYVFRRLTQPGVKRLTWADLAGQVDLWRSGVPLSPEDDRRVREVRDLVRSLEKRVDAVELEVGDLKLVTAGTAALLDDLARRQGFTAALEYVALSPPLKEPPRVDRASERQGTVSSILRLRGSASWIALHGVSGIGKSQLALLIARAVADTRVWMRFRDLPVAQACVRYDAALAMLAGLPAPSLSQPGGWAVDDPTPALTPLGRGAVIVLDDLPRFRSGDEFSVRLVSLARATAVEGIMLVSTAPLPIPDGVADSLPQGAIAVHPAPLFSNEEVRDVLLAFGAPKLWESEALVFMVHTATCGHPTLVRACARDLSAHGWAADAATVGRILGTGFAAGVNNETIRALLDSAPDPASRELLFRLNIIGGEFGIEEVRMLASVEPPVPTPRTHLDPLLGLWVQIDTDGRYAVSPLVRPLGSTELAPQTQRECHLVLARQIISREHVGEFEASQAMSHFLAGAEFDSAAWVYIRVLVALRAVATSAALPPVLAHAWLDSLLPERMPLGLRLMIRGLQLGLCIKSKRDGTYVRKDLDRLIALAEEEDKWAVFSAAMFAAEALSSTDVAGSGGYLLRALRLRSSVVAMTIERGIAAPDLPLEKFLWLMTSAVDSPAALAQWLDVVEGMTPAERAVAFEADDISAGGGRHVANQVMFREEEKPAEERDWPGVLGSLSALTTRARGMELHRLADAAVVTRMTIHAEFLRDMATAETLAEEVLARPRLDPDTAFLVTQNLGLLLYDYGRAERAIEWLQRAFALRTGTRAWKALRAAIFLSVRVGESDPIRAVEILSEAVEFADSHPGPAGLTRIEAYAELGVAKWLAGDLSGAFDPWDKAATLLLEGREDSPERRNILVVFLHMTGYFGHLARTGHAPDSLDGVQAYPAPVRGLFPSRPGRESLFDESQLPLLTTQLALFADAVGARTRAAMWADDAVTRCRTAGRNDGLFLVLPLLIAEALERDDYDVALALSWERQAIHEMVQLAGTGSMSTPFSMPSEFLGERGSDAWLGVEGRSMYVLIPTFHRLALLERGSPGAARTRIDGLTRALRACTVHSADPAAWETAAVLFSAIFDEGARGSDLVTLVNGYAFRSSDATWVLRMLGYMAASTRAGTPLEHSLELQLAGGRYIGLVILPDARPFAEWAGEFYSAFWRERFNAARFRFSNPQEVERLLGAAEQAGADRARRTLAAAAAGLSVSVPAEVRLWLQERTTSG
jgi:tetratricopeptide (TPR) repeat protein